MLPIYKIHGTYEEPDTIVVDEKDMFLQWIKNANYREVLESIFSNYVVLFYGFSFSDNDTEIILQAVSEKMGQSGKRHYALLPNVTSVEREYYMKKYNIQVISYDPSNNHEAAVQFIQRISDCI